MEIKISNLAYENLNDAPEWGNYHFSCKYCLYWEFAKDCIESKKENREDKEKKDKGNEEKWKEDKQKQDNFKKKLIWLNNTKKLFGNCGLITYIDGKPIGYAQYAPARFFQGSFNYPITPSDDAVLISCLFISQKELRRSGIGSKILESVIYDLDKKEIKAVETFARKDISDNPSGPAIFYIKNGFKIYKDDKEFPLMGLEL